MIPNYTSHAANERTFLAWIRTGLALAAFGLLLLKLNVLVDAVGGGSLPPHLLEGAAALASRYAGAAMAATGVAILARSGVAFERTRHAIDRDEVVPVSRSHAELLLSTAVAIAAATFCAYLASW
jgi:putative membrane protein